MTPFGPSHHCHLCSLLPGRRDVVGASDVTTGEQQSHGQDETVRLGTPLPPSLSDSELTFLDRQSGSCSVA